MPETANIPNPICNVVVFMGDGVLRVKPRVFGMLSQSCTPATPPFRHTFP
jgi:hypothetical protein